MNVNLFLPPILSQTWQAILLQLIPESVMGNLFRETLRLLFIGGGDAQPFISPPPREIIESEKFYF